ncbi:MAG: LptA/OstA family protein [Opitutaceae bacterium]
MIRLRRLALAALAALPCLALGAEPAALPAAPKAPLVPTEIVSGAAEMISTDKETTFTFSKGVTVTATNLKITCDDLVVISKRSGDPAATIGKQDNFKSLVATGRVHILQNDREAFCERAEVFPGDDKVILSGQPRVRSLDGQYQASGPKMELLRGERRARIIGDGDARPTITLPALKDLGYDKVPDKKKSAPAKTTATTPAAEEKTDPASPPKLTVPLPLAPK